MHFDLQERHTFIKMPMNVGDTCRYSWHKVTDGATGKFNGKIQKNNFSEQTKQEILHEMWLKEIKLQQNIQEMCFQVLFCVFIIFVPKSRTRCQYLTSLEVITVNVSPSGIRPRRAKIPWNHMLNWKNHSRFYCLEPISGLKSWKPGRRNEGLLGQYYLISDAA